MPRTVLVTGATGYIARHIVAKLLNRGDTVRGSARNLSRLDELRAALTPALDDPDALNRFSLVALTLTSDDGWADAMQGVDVLIHTASPFPMEQPKNPDDVIKPAVEGTLRALNAAHAAGINNVVMTSSSVAITEHTESRVFNETDWSTDTDAASPYARSKTRAERAAWDFVAEQAPNMRLAVINPTFVHGAPLGDCSGTSISFIERALSGKDPMVPRIGFPCCDVRDVAEAHIRAIDAKGAGGQRHIVADKFYWFADITRIIADAVPGSKPATRVAPNVLIRILSLFDPVLRSVLPQLGKKRDVDNTRLRTVLGITPRNAADSIAEAARWVAAQPPKP